jgi:hypothetical protein
MFSRKFKNSAGKIKVQLKNKFFRRKNENSAENSKIQRNFQISSGTHFVRTLTIIHPGILMIIHPPPGCLFSSF